jgi:hypothetical protein
MLRREGWLDQSDSRSVASTAVLACAPGPLTGVTMAAAHMRCNAPQAAVCGSMRSGAAPRVAAAVRPSCLGPATPRRCRSAPPAALDAAAASSSASPLAAEAAGLQPAAPDAPGGAPPPRSPSGLQCRAHDVLHATAAADGTEWWLEVLPPPQGAAPLRGGRGGPQKRQHQRQGGGGAGAAAAPAASAAVPPGQLRVVSRGVVYAAEEAAGGELVLTPLGAEGSTCQTMQQSICLNAPAIVLSCTSRHVQTQSYTCAAAAPAIHPSVALFRPAVDPRGPHSQGHPWLGPAAAAVWA